MSSNLLHDHKMKDMLCKVRDDVSHLKDEISHLFSPKARHRLADRAHDLADYARDGLHAGGAFAASQLRYIRRHPGQSTGLLGGLILLGAVGFGIYYVCKSGPEKPRHKPARKQAKKQQHQDADLPPYIS
jgi:hypothetical protein